MAVARSAVQSAYLSMLRNSSIPIVVSTGKAGTGKTHLAVVEGASALMRKEVSRLVLARPAVNAGEQLGFLPGTADEKLDPFMRPMLDSLGTVLTTRQICSLRADGCIELAPVGFMRGRTFHDTWVVLDEAQNVTPVQMKMILTRLGKDSKMVVTGDVEQTDLVGPDQSGLADLLARLSGRRWDSVSLIGLVELGESDVQRSAAVQEVLGLYKRG